MTPRDERLLPRLIEILNSADNERELGMAVLQLRRILATDQRKLSDLLQARQPVEAMPTIDDRHDIYVRLRELGQMMQSVGHADPRKQARLHDIGKSLTYGRPISFADMRELLAAIRDLWRDALRTAREASNPGWNGNRVDPPDPRFSTHRQTFAFGPQEMAMMEAALRAALYRGGR